MKTSRSYSHKTLKLLWGRSGNMCAHGQCRQQLTVDATASDPTVTLGQICHILPASNDSSAPRQDLDAPMEGRNEYENLILLCPTHHSIVDDQPNTFTADDLHRWKAEHELWVRQTLEEAAPSVSFHELSIIADSIGDEIDKYPIDFGSVKVKQKISRNNLSDGVAQLIKHHIGNTFQVSEYVRERAKIDPAFPVRLKTAFVNKYSELVHQDYEGDALFYALGMFASQSAVSGVGATEAGTSTMKLQAAGTSLLVYLFEICDVFER